MKAAMMALTFFLLFSSAVSALECSRLDESLQPDCAYINSQDISQEEKDSLLSNLLSEKSYTPDHEAVFSWNTQIDFSSPPEGVATTHSAWIKNTWLALATVMPSVLQHDQLLVPKTVSALSAYNYQIDPPQDYNSPFWPLTKQGSCRIDYTPAGESTSVAVYANGQKKGDGGLCQFNITSDSTITSQLAVDVSYHANHYNWHKYCCSWGEEGCIKWCRECRYSDSRVEKDSLTLTDSKEVKLYDKQPFANITILDNPRGALRFEPVIDEETSSRFSFDNAFLKHTENFYSFNYSLAPYYIMQLVSKQEPQERNQGLIKDEEHFLVKTNSCSISTWNHFYTNTTDCDLSFDKESLRISTDKVFYKTNETIYVSVEPSDENITLSYGNQTLSVQGLAEFRAQPLTSQITATDNIRKTQTVIHVKEEGNFVFVAKMTVLGILAYSGYAFARKVFSRAVGETH